MKHVIFLVIGLFLGLLCTQAIAEEQQVTRYIRINLSDLNTAYMYDEDFNQFPDSPWPPRTSAERIPDKSLWLKSSRVDIVERLGDGTIEVKSEDPRYAKLLHHAALAYADGIKYTSGFPIQYPIVAGSELTDAILPAPYAYQVRGGYWTVATWHWHNFGGLSVEQDVYLRLVNLYENDCSTCIDTQSVWFDSVPENQGSEFCIPTGEHEYEGMQKSVEERSRVVGVTGHIHDHGSLLQMIHNGKPIHDFVPELGVSLSYHISHYAGCRNTFWHEHDGHTRVKSIQFWNPGGDGPILEPGDSIGARTYYDNPHTTEIDGMGIFITFLEILK